MAQGQQPFDVRPAGGPTPKNSTVPFVLLGGCAGAVVVALVGCGALALLGAMRDRAHRNAATGGPAAQAAASAWIDDPAVRRVAFTWDRPGASGYDAGCRRVRCRSYTDLPPWDDAGWAQALTDSTAKRIVLNDGPIEFCDVNRWAPKSTIQLWRYNGQYVYLLEGGGLDGAYFTSHRTDPASGPVCQIIIMTATWPAHQDD